MNALATRQTSVTRKLCAPTLKDPMFVAVLVATLAMDEIVQVSDRPGIQENSCQSLHSSDAIPNRPLFAHHLKCLDIVNYS